MSLDKSVLLSFDQYNTWRQIVFDHFRKNQSGGGETETKDSPKEPLPGGISVNTVTKEVIQGEPDIKEVDINTDVVKKNQTIPFYVVNGTYGFVESEVIQFLRFDRMMQ